MHYQDFLEYIYRRHSANVKLGLERMYEILQRLDNPHLKLRGVHIAGTNGKGSTSAIVESLLLAAGHTTGLNTSPHLVDYTERFRLNGKNITADELMLLYGRYAHLFDQTEASFFEITTALAFQYFVENDVQSAVFEVGLGGRLDGTNPFKSTVCVITSIAIDHPKTLGDTIEQIAFEKAGIIKLDTPVVLGDLPENALSVILAQAQKNNAPVYQIGKDFFVRDVRLTAEGTVFDYEFPLFDIAFKDLKLNLLGWHQAHNAGLGLTAYLLYVSGQNKDIPLPYPPPDFLGGAIATALQKVNWFGRMQILSSQPLVLVDGAHNEQGVSALIKSIKDIFPNHRYHFLVAILRDKRLDNMIREICTVAEDIYISKNPSDRAADIEEQVAVAQECGTKYFVAGDIVQSMEQCLSKMTGDDEMLIITGSLYTIAEVLRVSSVQCPVSRNNPVKT